MTDPTEDQLATLGNAFETFTRRYKLAEARRAVSPNLLRITGALGALIFAGTGVYSLLRGGNFLDYDYLAHDAVHGQHYGLLLVEFGVGLTVSSVITSVFYVFAGRGRRREQS